jgi:SPP1 gp7 family putative phage head morphogenesis protein
VAEAKRNIGDLIGRGGPVAERLMALPAQEVFSQKMRYLRELYLDDAVERWQGEEDDLKKAFLGKLTDWAQTGGELDVAELVDRMEETSARRAKFFARDQFAKFNRSVTLAGYQQADVQYFEWLTSNDGRVRETHRERNHRIYTMQELLADPEYNSYNCFVPGTEIQGAILAGLKAKYSGCVVTIVTSRGHKLTVTANHPIYSDGEWISARDLCKGKTLLSYQGNQESSLRLRFPNKENGPTSIENIFSSLGGHRTVESRTAYLDGDGERIEGDIEVSSAAGFLSGHRKTEILNSFREFFFKTPFPPVRSVPSLFSEESYLGKMALGAIGLRSSDPCLSALAFDQLSVFFDEVPLVPLCFGLASRIDTCVNQSAKDGRTRDSEFERQLVTTHSGEIVTDKIVDVQKNPYSGHVYDLQSTTGWIVAQDLIVGNCRCGFAPLWNLTPAQERRRVA